MAVAPTREDNGRKVLDVYQHFNSEAGDVLRANNFVAIAARWNWRTKYLTEGLEYAVERGWIEELSTGGIRLTQAGYAAM